MRQRIIAAFVLTALVLGSVPAVWASIHIAPAAKVQKASAPSHDHDCCPGLHPKITFPIVLSIAPGPMPCGKEHPCCAKPGPQNPPTLPATGKVSRPDPQPNACSPVDGLASSRRADLIIASNCPHQASLVRSTVLRI